MLRRKPTLGVFLEGKTEVPKRGTLSGYRPVPGIGQDAAAGPGREAEGFFVHWHFHIDIFHIDMFYIDNFSLCTSERFMKFPTGFLSPA